ncbi:hypothetical protein [Pirellula sp. SH-Sr6A]|uniref:hypothetical protein n=1 Tax=Pirellula sp. SH-Sr6A TaxID=1632865 RepID=UPI0011BA96D6|nr:hypothetical protein [Pirellula sp. SH-Sr6A]
MIRSQSDKVRNSFDSLHLFSPILTAFAPWRDTSPPGTKKKFLAMARRRKEKNRTKETVAIRQSR